MSFPFQNRLFRILLQETPSNLRSPRRLFQLHSLLITTGLHYRYPSTIVSLLQLYLSSPSTLSHAANLFPHIQEPSKWNLMIRHASANSPLKALSLFREMRVVMGNGYPGTPLNDDSFVYASLIKACNKAWAFREGKSVHGHVIRFGLDYNVNVLNSLVCFYMGSANLVSYAAVLFDMVSEKSVVSFNCMISGHIDRGNLDLGVSLFAKMLSGCFGLDVKPNYVTFVILISGCVEFGGYRTGNVLHCCCCKIGLENNTEVCNALIDIYAKFGCISDAANVFGEMPARDLISWNAMMWGYANNGDSRQAFSLFRKMRINEIRVDRVSFSCLLSACASLKDLYLGRMIHAHVKTIGLESDVSVQTALINMYAKCRKVEYARKLFNELPKQNIESWNSMIHAYIEHGLPKEALKLFIQIRSKELEPDEITILGLIRACRDAGDLHKGVLIHSIIEGNDLFKRSILLGNALIDMYAKCGSISKARAVFNEMPHKDVISWTSMIMGHAINGEGDKSLTTFKQMCNKKLVPNSVTFVGVLAACDHAGLVDEGRKLYNMMYDVYRIKPQIEHCGCVIDMLARAGKIEDAQTFVGEMPMEPNALVWRMLINACRVHSNVNLGLNLVTGVKELNTSPESGNFVISSNIFAEAGKWGDVISRRSLMVAQEARKMAGTSSVSYLTE